MKIINDMDLRVCSLCENFEDCLAESEFDGLMINEADECLDFEPTKEFFRLRKIKYGVGK